jgi:hypothetical protein
VTIWSPRVPTLLYPAVQGARLMQFSLFRPRWKDFGFAASTRGISAVEAVRMARYGFVPELTSPPRQISPPKEPSWSAAQLSVMTDITNDLLETSQIEPVPDPDFSLAKLHLAALSSMCFYAGVPFQVPKVVLPFVHVMFAVPKKGNKWRGVSGLSMFNSNVVPRHFKMEGLHSLRALLRPLDFMAVIDLSAAFPTMGINMRYRDYFIFRFRGKFYRYRGAVFGISSLPRAFTKLLRPVIAFLRSFGIRLVIFIDDIQSWASLTRLQSPTCRTS